MVTKFDKDIIAKRCEEFFASYSFTEGRTFDMCQAKLIHTRAVAENCYIIAQGEGLSQNDCDLAWTIGELHDFARFEQIVVTKSFSDSDLFDHAKMGARMLFTNHMVDDIIPDYQDISDEDKLVLEKAVYYHSSYSLPSTLSEREHLFCSIIREADQLDIFRTVVESGWKTLNGNDKETILASDISDEIAEAFHQRKLVDYSKRVTPADYHMSQIALCFGLHSAKARKRALEQGFLTKLMDITFKNPSVQKKYMELKKLTLEYLHEDDVL